MYVCITSLFCMHVCMCVGGSADGGAAAAVCEGSHQFHFQHAPAQMCDQSPQ